MTRQLLMGNALFAAAALEAGVRVVAGYPGTPSSELIETIAKRVQAGQAHDVHVEWSTNEKAALELLAGASLCGARCLFTCKQVGLNVASDALMSLNYVGVKGGLVLFVADDPGPISSQTEQDTRRFASFAKLPVLDPSTPEEGFAMMQQAFDLSEQYRTPVIVRPTTRVCHSSCAAEVAAQTQAAPLIEGFKRDVRQVIFPKRSYEAHGEVNERLRDIARDFSALPQWTALSPLFEKRANEADEVRKGVVACGISAAYTREALRNLSATYKFWQVGTPYPFPAERANEFLDGLDEVMVFEELDSVVEEELLKLMAQRALEGKSVPVIRGKLSRDVRDRGENSVDDIAQRLKRYVCEAEGESDAAATEENKSVSPDKEAQAAIEDTIAQALAAIPGRPPTLCGGCPHRASFFAVKQALGKQKAVYCGDIGCYTLGNARPLETTDTCLCMGAGITMAQGIVTCEPDTRAVAFVGDSTFFASAMTGIANAVYNNHRITVCVLDNSTTAMTGLQPHPGIGNTLMGGQKPGLSIRRILEALGVGYIKSVDPLAHDEAVAVMREALDWEGVSAVIFKSPCIQISKGAAALAVDTEACTGCKKCIRSLGCPAIMFDHKASGPKSGTRGQAYIEPTLCNGCGLCTYVCPAHCIQAASASEKEGEALC